MDVDPVLDLSFYIEPIIPSLCLLYYDNIYDGTYSDISRRMKTTDADYLKESSYHKNCYKLFSAHTSNMKKESCLFKAPKNSHQ